MCCIIGASIRELGLPDAQRRHVSMKKNIITISREFGSGGRTIGKTVAERLGGPLL